jgi:hypothetical protein
MPRGPSTPTSIARAWAAPPQLARDPGPEFQNPAPYRFIGNLQAALDEEFLDVAVAQCETKIEPNRVLDNHGREAVPAIGELIHAGSLPHQVARSNSVSVTTPVCRKHGVSSATFYKWKAKFGGLDVSDAKRRHCHRNEVRSGGPAG